MRYVDLVLGRTVSDLCTAIVPGDQPVPSFGSKADLVEHDAMLVAEFSGSTELALCHALVTVRLRRGVEVELNRHRHVDMWDGAAERLCRELNSRWLVSACDTVVDHWPGSHDRALALAGTLLMNTIKLYETERRLGGGLGHAVATAERVPLFDGMDAFLIGEGNLPLNLAQRLSKQCSGSTAGLILLELFDRANRVDSVYGRFRSRHQNASTRW